MEEDYLTRRDLAQRGWSDRAMDFLLDEVDTWLPVEHWQNFVGAQAWRRERVLVSELSPDFEVLFRSWIARARIPPEKVALFRERRAQSEQEARELIAGGRFRVPRVPLFAFSFLKVAETVAPKLADEIYSERLSHYRYGRLPGSHEREAAAVTVVLEKLGRLVGPEPEDTFSGRLIRLSPAERAAKRQRNYGPRRLRLIHEILHLVRRGRVALPVEAPRDVATFLVEYPLLRID